MSFSNRHVQRAFLAFTTGLFLSCAAEVSAAAEPSGTPVSVAAQLSSAPGSAVSDVTAVEPD
jgi:hypothetical protein